MSSSISNSDFPFSARRYFLGMVFGALCLIVVLMFLPHERGLRFGQMQNHYVKFRWVYERTHQSELPVDVVLIGSSRMMLGMHGRAIEEAMEGRHAVVNFALPGYGRNMQYLILRELLTQKNPQLVVLEVREREGRVGHEHFGLLADPHDVLRPKSYVNIRGIADLGDCLRRQGELYVQSLPLFAANGANRPALDNAHWQNRKKKPLRLEDIRKGRDIHVARIRKGGAFDNMFHAYSFSYLDAMIKLAKERGIHVAFLYLPHFEHAARPANEEYYTSRGPVWTLPKEIIDDPSMWADGTHIGPQGAHIAAPLIAEHIRALLAQPEK